MKKLLFMLFVTALFTTSCSSDNDPITGDNQTKGKVYQIDLNLQSPAFEINKTPLKEAIGDADRLIKIVVYKKTTGEVYSDTILYSGTYASTIESGKVPVSLSMPEGDYSVAVVNNRSKTSAGQTHNLQRWDPANYTTDIIENGAGTVHFTDIRDANYSVYYNTFDISVPAQVNTPLDVVLEPMWSTVRVKFTDPANFTFPEGSTYARVDLIPAAWDFHVNTKLAVNHEDGTHLSWMDATNSVLKSMIPQDSITLDYLISKTDAENNKMKLKMIYYVNENDNTIVSEKIIDLNAEIENAKNYKITGRLGNIWGENSNFNISLGEFNPEDVVINF